MTSSSTSTTATTKARKKELNFAESVHRLVTEVSHRDPTMIRWTSDGAAFRVSADHPQLGDALAKYFQHSKYSSFQRQLNQYGWTKPRSGRYIGTFFNPLFQRDSDIEEVRRIGRGGCKKNMKLGVEVESMTPSRSKRSSSSSSASTTSSSTSTSTTAAAVSATAVATPSLATPSPHRPKSRLPLQKRPVNIPSQQQQVSPSPAIAPPKTVSPLTSKSTDNPSADDMTAVQLLLGMIQKPVVEQQEQQQQQERQRPSDCSVESSLENTVPNQNNNQNTIINNSRRAKSRNFALAVHDLVSQADASDPKMIRWVEDGTAFVIDPTHPKLGASLGKYFQHSKYSSFQRQLNQYGWCKLRNTGKFYNQYFHRDKQQCTFDMIQRKDKKTAADFSLSSGRGSKRSLVSGSSSSPKQPRQLEYISVPAPTKRRRMSSISEPRLHSVSDEDTISSEDGSILSTIMHRRDRSISDLVRRPPSNVMAYLPRSSYH